MAEPNQLTLENQVEIVQRKVAADPSMLRRTAALALIDRANLNRVAHAINKDADHSEVVIEIEMTIAALAEKIEDHVTRIHADQDEMIAKVVAQEAADLNLIVVPVVHTKARQIQIQGQHRLQA